MRDIVVEMVDSDLEITYNNGSVDNDDKGTVKIKKKLKKKNRSAAKESYHLNEDFYNVSKINTSDYIPLSPSLFTLDENKRKLELSNSSEELNEQKIKKRKLNLDYTAWESPKKRKKNHFKMENYYNFFVNQSFDETLHTSIDIDSFKSEESTPKKKKKKRKTTTAPFSSEVDTNSDFTETTNENNDKSSSDYPFEVSEFQINPVKQKKLLKKIKKLSNVLKNETLSDDTITHSIESVDDDLLETDSVILKSKKKKRNSEKKVQDASQSVTDESISLALDENIKTKKTKNIKLEDDIYFSIFNNIQVGKNNKPPTNTEKEANGFSLNTNGEKQKYSDCSLSSDYCENIATENVFETNKKVGKKQKREKNSGSPTFDQTRDIYEDYSITDTKLHHFLDSQIFEKKRKTKKLCDQRKRFKSESSHYEGVSSFINSGSEKTDAKEKHKKVKKTKKSKSIANSESEETDVKKKHKKVKKSKLLIDDTDNQSDQVFVKESSTDEGDRSCEVDEADKSLECKWKQQIAAVRESCGGDELDILKNIDIVLPFENIPPLHVIKRASKPTREEILLSKQLNAKTGSFTKVEDKQIKRNWKNFCKDHQLSLGPSVFFKFTKSLSVRQKVKFLQYLSHKLDDRLPYNVHKRFCRLYRDENFRYGRYTRKEDRQILEYLSKSYSRKPYRDLGLLLNRSDYSIERRVALLTSTDNQNKLEWNKNFPLLERLIRALLTVTDLKDVEDLENVTLDAKQWNDLSLIMDNIPVNKLRRAWYITLHPKLFLKEKDVDVRRDIIKLLTINGEKDYRAINWKKYAEQFYGANEKKLYEMFVHMVNFYVPKKDRSDLSKVLLKLSTVYKGSRADCQRYVYKNGRLKVIK